MQSLNLDIVVVDRSLILGACIHLALNFSHNDARYSIFWGSNTTTSYLRGMSTRKYPFLGLNDVSNITSTFPAGVHLYQALARRDRTVTRYTYSQAYTPMTKALDPSAFKERPFLLALLLGKDYVKEQTYFAHIYNSTAKLLEYQQIQEAIEMNLTKSEARLEFVLCAPSTVSHLVVMKSSCKSQIWRQRTQGLAKHPHVYISPCTIRNPPIYQKTFVGHSPHDKLTAIISSSNESKLSLLLYVFTLMNYTLS